MQSASSAVFTQNKAICGGRWTFPWENCSSQTDPEAMGFDLYVTFHQDNLELPALKPSHPEGIGHGALRVTNSPYGPVGTVQGVLSGNAVQTSFDSGFLADQMRVMK